jgi:peptidoglycan glycosyltransferase
MNRFLFRSPVSAVSGQPSAVLFALAFLFTGLAFTQLGLVNRSLTPAGYLPLLVLIGCGSVPAWLLHVRRQPGDPLLLPLVYFLCGFGLALTARLAPNFLTRQLAWLAVSTLLLLLVVLLPKNLNWLRRYKYSWLTGGLALLSTTLLFGVNPSGYGARLWLNMGGLYVQPSEPLKLLLVVFLAGYMAHRHRQLVEIKARFGPLRLPHPSYWGPMLLMWGFSMVLLIWQRDLGAALLFFGTFLGMLYAATGQSRYIWAGALLLLAAGGAGFYLFDVVQLRIEAFLNPWLDPSGRSFQIVQSLLAFAAGGVFGQGLGQGLPTAIPVVHTDFVFAAIGEEYGLLGALAVLICFALLVSRAFAIALRAAAAFEQLLAAGIGVMIGLQTLVITAGTLKLLPLTGVTLPFVSYGGSSLLTSFVMVAVLVFIANERGSELANQRGSVWAIQRISEKVNGEFANGESASRRINESANLRINEFTNGESSLPSYPPAPPPLFLRPPFSANNLKLARGLLTGFLVVAGGLLLWQVAAVPFLVSRPDNPRPIIAEQQIDRGRLLTAGGIPMAETVLDENGLARRHYPYPGLSTVTGYYSLRHGVGGTEATFDPILRGAAGRVPGQAWLDNLLHRPLVGQDVTLTINLPAQAAADVALGQREGAVVVLDIETGAIRVMSSHPTYNPNTLDEQWDTLRQDKQAPLLNRATQGLYPVGDLARLVGLIGLVQAGARLPVDPRTAPLASLLAPLGPTGYLAAAHQLGLTRPLRGLASQPARLPDFTQKETARELAVSPLHMARVVAALELRGELPQPGLAFEGVGALSPGFSPAAARAGRSLLTPVEGSLIGLSGQAAPVETGQAWLSWFVGLAPTTALPLAAPVEMLPFDPAQATPAVIPAPPLPQPPPARYVVVAVVVTAQPDATLARRIAAAPLRVLLD